METANIIKKVAAIMFCQPGTVMAMFCYWCTQGILTYRRYTQREFKLKFSALLKPMTVNILKTVKKKSIEHCHMIHAPGGNI